jgi:hypothetical protein
VLGPWIVDEVVCILLLILIGLLLLCCCCCLIWILLGLLRGCKRKEKEDRGEEVGGVELTDNPMLRSGNSLGRDGKQLKGLEAKRKKPKRKKKVWSLRRLFQKHDSVELGSDDEDDDEEWDTAYDDDGNEYFYNAKTGRSTWTVPKSLKRKLMKKFSKKIFGGRRLYSEDFGSEDAERARSDTAGSWQSNVDADGNTYYYDENGRSTWTDPQRKGSNKKMWGQRSMGNEFEKESDRARSDTAGSWQSNVDADGNTYYQDENGRSTWTDPQRKGSNKKMWGQRSIGNEDDDWSLAHDEAGRPYFYNERTGQTSWEDPTRRRFEGSKKQFPSTKIAAALDSPHIPYYYHNALAKDGTGENAVGEGTDKATKKNILKKKEWRGRKIRRTSVSQMV